MLRVLEDGDGVGDRVLENGAILAAAGEFARRTFAFGVQRFGEPTEFLGERGSRRIGAGRAGEQSSRETAIKSRRRA